MLYIDIDNVFAMVRAKAIQDTPVIERSMDSGSPVFTESFAKKVFRAYIPAGFALGVPYTRYDTRENTTAWITPYFAKVRANIPDMETIFATSGRGYKYRDVIWMLLCALHKCAQVRTTTDATASVMQDAYKLWTCMTIERTPADVFIGTADEIRAKREEVARRDAAEEQAARRSETPVAPTPGEPERTVQPVAPITPEPAQSSNAGIIAVAAAAVIGFFMLK